MPVYNKLILIMFSIFLVSCSSLKGKQESSNTQQVKERYYERNDRKW